MIDSSDTLEIAGIPNLTKINWSQRLVESIRLHVWSGSIASAYPTTREGAALDDAELKYLSKDLSDLSKIVAQKSSESALVFAPAPATKIDYDHDAMVEVRKRVLAFTERLDNPSRAGAILSVVLTELGWPVHLVIKALNTSRPTISRWVFIHQNNPLTDEELTLFDAFVNESKFTYLFDLRTYAFKAKRTGFVFKKAVFLPSKEVIVLMKALWRVAYRVRGNKSGSHEQECSQTLDMIVELLLRRGATSLNIARILGIQHMAVIQRSRRTIDTFGNVEQLSGRFDVERAHEYTVYNDRTNLDADTVEMPAILLQVRTNTPSKSRTIPQPNVSVLSGKNVVTNFGDLTKLDTIPGYALSGYLDSLPGKYRTVMPNLYRRNQLALVEYCLSVNPKLSVMSPLVNASVGILGFNGVKYGKDNPSEWRSGRFFTEHYLLQATMNYDRDRYFTGFGKTTYHWVPAEILDIIDIVPDASKEDVESLADVSADRVPTDIDSLLAFFPTHHRKMILGWMNDADNPNAILKSCFFTPDVIMSKYEAPAPRGVATSA